ncbi:MAG: hypothetical protein LUH22_10610 [Bacteroides sp.]|nr:hypothetical protein [Bacteroides sp.]
MDTLSVEIEKLIAAGWITAGVLASPVFFILFDLWAGIRKARERGEKITSNGLRQTFAKTARYYNALLALLIIDAIQMAGFWYMNVYYGHNIPVFPFLTLLGAIGVGIIEVKSIFEKADDKMKQQASDVALLAGELAKHKSDPSELAKAIVEYMHKTPDYEKD